MKDPSWEGVESLGRAQAELAAGRRCFVGTSGASMSLEGFHLLSPLPPTSRTWCAFPNTSGSTVPSGLCGKTVKEGGLCCSSWYRDIDGSPALNVVGCVGIAEPRHAIGTPFDTCLSG